MLNRREFITDTAAAAGLCACGLGSSGCAALRTVGATPPIATDAFSVNGQELRVDLAKASPLARVGGAVKLIDHAAVPPVIIARASDDTYLVASITCTHAGKEVEYNHADQTFDCVSQSVFAADGARVSGPAAAPLTLYPVRVEAGLLIIGFPA